MDILALALLWCAGSALALLGNRKIREYKCYRNPVLFLVSGVVLSVLMSWGMVIGLVMNGSYSLPDCIYHSCYDNSSISYEEEYLDGEGRKSDFRNCKTHNTYRVYKCRKCGKTWKEQI